jgi:hypothetical protein
MLPTMRTSKPRSLDEILARVEKRSGNKRNSKQKGATTQPLLIRRSLLLIQRSVGGLVLMHENGEQDNDWQRNA